jgi:iron(III) transport system permease protein
MECRRLGRWQRATDGSATRLARRVGRSLAEADLQALAPRLLAGAFAALALLPVLALAVVAARGSGPLWPHLLQTVLPMALRETALYLAGIGVLSAVLGTGTAWLVAVYRFPGCAILAWLLLLPLTMPAYIAAYAWLDLLHPVGPIQGGLRAILSTAGLTAPRLPDIRSLGGCILVSGCVLYPYVYLNARAAFAGQAADALWAARGLGASGLRLFLRIGLPMARPAVAVGLGLALMEALNDIGASEFLGVRTLTVSIYVTWLTRGSLEGAAQIALVLLGPVLLALALERWGRRRYVFTGDAAPGEKPRLTGWRGAAACLACLVPVLGGFVLPVSYLAWNAAARVAAFGLPADLAGWLVNSAWYAGWAAALTLAGGFALALAARFGRSSLLFRVGSIGYALPGGVVAVGLIVAFGAIDGTVDAAMRHVAGAIAAWSFLGSGLALVVAYVIRFLAVPAAGLDAAYAALGRDYDRAAQTLGCGAWRLLTRIHAPLLARPLAAAGVIVFIDAMKELPATLLLRPVNVETLATALYGEAIRGTYEDGAVAALTLILVASLPAGLLGLLHGGSMRRLPRRAATRWRRLRGCDRERRVASAT